MEQPKGQEIAGARRRATCTILAVGSDRARLNAMAQRLGNLGYLVVLGDSGVQALELISARGFDLVLFDAALPEGTALQVVKEVRSARDTADLPMVMLTRDADVTLEGLAAGADDCIAEPRAFEEIATRIERTLARARRVDELKRSNLALDARIAARAMELGEVKAELAATRADRARLIASIRALHDELDRLQGVA